jgi:hypothetical protein
LDARGFEIVAHAQTESVADAVDLIVVHIGYLEIFE